MTAEPTDADRDALREEIAAALRAHQWEAVNRSDGSTSAYRCTCGHIPPDTPSLDDHRADAVLDVLAPHLDALDRARDVAAWVNSAAEGRSPLWAAAYRDIAERLSRALDGDGA